MFGYKFEKLFIYTVILIFGFNILKVNAIRCHQCNSLVDLHCDDLKYNAETMTITDQFLKDCTVPQNADKSLNHTLFCRKTTYFLNYEQSSRTVRACGWLRDHNPVNEYNKNRKSCISADNEGYLETICICDEDGCNSAPNQLTKFTNILISCCTIIGFLLLKYLNF
ncbi:uncharacterized protein LOC129615882 [Condylostylus longicornis]|uniref:uncharacterized protein LOC129615882 n=1 Tax=Condylostylus longicornis TaxID=2530218 RepID=UPI00244E26E0|nr:uncharacterized protein LOC129615882 [Condylostylus longicornis]